jgi:hypothetical protein
MIIIILLILMRLYRLEMTLTLTQYPSNSSAVQTKIQYLDMRNMLKFIHRNFF